MSFALGLTGSIGMGKSTTAGIFRDLGCDVWDADAAVHRLYARGGLAVAPMQALFPDAVRDGVVDRGQLKSLITADGTALQKIEDIVHPLVAQDRAEFRAGARSDVLVFDVPLLFETGGDAAMDAVAVVSVDAETQKERVLARGTMSQSQFESILSKQISDADKRARADYVIKTDTLDHAQEQVEAIIKIIRAR